MVSLGLGFLRGFACEVLGLRGAPAPSVGRCQSC